MTEIDCRFDGHHALAEFGGVQPHLLDDEGFLTTTLRTALTRAEATVLEVVAKRFEPQGVTVLALLSESHASIHTYPEFGAVFLDVFTCGDKAKPAIAIDYLAEALQAQTVSRNVIRRGHVTREAVA